MPSQGPGFTLVELLLVIVIIGVLAGMVIAVLKPSYFYGKGRDAQRRSDLNLVKAALELYRLDQTNRQFPNTSYSSLPISDYIQGGSLPTDPGSYSYSYDPHTESNTSDPKHLKCFELSVSLEGGGTCSVCGGTATCVATESWSCECE